MPYSVNIIRLLEKVEPSTREVLLAVLEEIERQRETTVTKKEFNELKEIVKDLGKTVKELAEAQKKTEAELKKLVGEHRKTRKQLGGLAHTVGYVLEDRAFVGLLPLLEREYGLKVLEPLKRDFVEIGPGKYLEVNILGKAVQDGKKFVIIGECKTQLKKEDINKFLKTLNLLKDIFTEEIFPVLVTYQASPQVQNYVRQKGLKLYFSYQFPLVF